MTYLYVVLLLLVFTIVVSAIGSSMSKERRQTVFRKRPLLSREAWWREYGGAFPDVPEDFVSAMLDELESEHGVPKGSLRPTDRYDRELAPTKRWEDWDDAESAWQEGFYDAGESTRKDPSVRNYILLMWEREKKFMSRREERKRRKARAS